MGEPHRPHASKHIQRRLQSVAMSLLRTVSVLVVMAVVFNPSHSLPQPGISFAALGAQKDNLIASIGGFKKQLQPVIGLKQGLLGAKKAIISPIVGLKAGLLAAKFGLASGIKDAKLNLARGILRPVAGIKRGKLIALRGVLDSKINKLGDF